VIYPLLITDYRLLVKDILLKASIYPISYFRDAIDELGLESKLYNNNWAVALPN
jgi:hypothetical protein